MATIIVEDGTGLVNSNSYVTLVEADAYFTDTGNLGWAGTDDSKNQNLINATSALDAVYGRKYISFLRDDTTQALLWPRQDIWDRHARRINEGSIPQALKNAQFEYALLSQNGVNLFPEGRTDNNLLSESVTVGEISQSKSYNRPPKEQATFEAFRQIELLLWPILITETQAIRFAI